MGIGGTIGMSGENRRMMFIICTLQEQFMNTKTASSTSDLVNKLVPGWWMKLDLPETSAYL